MDLEYITLKFAETEWLVDDDELSRYVREYEGAVLLVGDDDSRQSIGTFRAFYIDVNSAIAEGEPICDIFDQYEETSGYYDLYDDELDFKPSVEKAMGAGGQWTLNMVVLDRLIVEPAWRGKGRGLVALRGLIEALRPGAGIVAMKPFPLQGEVRFNADRHRDERVRLRLDDFSKDLRKATAVLRKYYARLGFARVPRTDLMVLDPGRKLTPIDELTLPGNAIV